VQSEAQEHANEVYDTASCKREREERASYQGLNILSVLIGPSRTVSSRVVPSSAMAHAACETQRQEFSACGWCAHRCLQRGTPGRCGTRTLSRECRALAIRPCTGVVCVCDMRISAFDGDRARENRSGRIPRWLSKRGQYGVAYTRLALGQRARL
jgi:hypothetical protein